MQLSEFTKAQLIEELARRENTENTKEPEQWCHDCRHFVAWNDLKDSPKHKCPENYNPCSKGKHMKFFLPKEIGDEFGFYLQACTSRVVLPPEF